MSGPQFRPKTVYVIYIAAAPERVFQALTDPAFTEGYFGGLQADIEPREGARFFCAVPTGACISADRWLNGPRPGGSPVPGRWRGWSRSTDCRNAW
jgi:hypothetical protein